MDAQAEAQRIILRGSGDNHIGKKLILACRIRTSELTLTQLMIDHDRLFKELLSTFFMEFLELFIPDLAQTIDPDSIRFLQQEYFVDLTSGEEKIIDLLVEVRQAGEEMAFLELRQNVYDCW
jgi:hypothetical protein